MTTARLQTHLKLLPEALLDFVGGLGQFAQLPHSTLDFGGVDARRVQRLVGGNKRKRSFQVHFELKLKVFPGRTRAEVPV